MTQKIFQGDVAFIKISQEQFEKLLKGKNPERKMIKGEFILVHGESGNTHKIIVERPVENKVELLDFGNGIFGLKINGEAIITHEKHQPPQKLGNGFWFVGRKTEYDPVQERLIKD